MTKNYKVSVVIPIYGVELYLPSCIDSVISQTYKDIEVILVDDKSPDSSGDIADRYVIKDNRVKVIHNLKNEGLNMARSIGFKASSGDFVTFIDSDDQVTLDYIEKLVCAQKKTNADITMSGYIFYDSKLEEPLSPQPIPQQPILDDPTFYNQEQMIYYYLTQWLYWKHNNNTSTTCCKLFRRKVVEKIKWNETNYSIGEDDFETLYTIANAKRFAVINDQTYMYRANPNSISNSKKFTPKYQGKPISVFDICSNFENKTLVLLGDKYNEAIYYRVYIIYVYYITLLLNKSSLNENDIKVFNDKFPLEKIKSVKKYPIDEKLTNLVDKGGLLNYLLNWLWDEYKASELNISNQGGASISLQKDRLVDVRTKDLISALFNKIIHK